MPYHGAMEWLMALACGEGSLLREWFLAGPWVEAAVDPDLTAYEMLLDRRSWVVLPQNLPRDDRQLRWGTREQEIALCSFPWLSPAATFAKRGQEIRQPANELAGACLADVKRLLSETIPRQLRNVEDWARTTPKDIASPRDT
jgi:hypothetical protein